MNYPYTKLKSFKCQTCLLISLFICLNVYSQESSLNLYSNWSYFPSEKINHIDIGNSEVGYSGLSFAYRKMNQNSKFHEIELKTGLRFTDNTETSDKRVYNHIKYELGKQKPLGSSGKFNFQYGVGFRLLHYYAQQNPKVPNSFRLHENIFGIGISFQPGISYNLNQNLYVQLKANIADTSLYAQYSKTDRPDLREDVRRNANFNFDFILTQGFMFGVGYKIGKK